MNIKHETCIDMHKIIKHVLVPNEIYKNKTCSRYQLNLIYAKHKYAYKTLKIFLPLFVNHQQRGKNQKKCSPLFG